MKIKGSVKSLKINSAFIVFGVGAILSLCIRTYQALGGLIDFETGFYERQDITIYLLCGILILASIAIFAISNLSWEIPQEKMPKQNNTLLSIFSGVFAAALAFDGAKKFILYNEISSSFMGESKQQMSYLMKSGAIPQLAQSIFAVLSVVYFVILLLNYCGLREVNFKKFKLFSLCPLFWATFRMIERFTRTISYMNVSGLLLELFMIAFMMMFFMYMAQMSSEVNANAISSKVFSYGLIGSMLAITVSLPRLIMFVADSEYRTLAADGLLECPLEIADLAFGLFCVVFLVSCLQSPRIKNMTLKETEKMING